mgnify:CR=1 FL=1
MFLFLLTFYVKYYIMPILKKYFRKGILFVSNKTNLLDTVKRIKTLESSLAQLNELYDEATYVFMPRCPLKEMDKNFEKVSSENYNPDLISVVDEEGVTHTFEELDRIETDDGRFVALLPVYEEAEDIIDDDGELIILSVNEDEDGEIYLEPIEDEKLFNKIGKIFEERLEDLFEFDDEE